MVAARAMPPSKPATAASTERAAAAIPPVRPLWRSAKQGCNHSHDTARSAASTQHARPAHHAHTRDSRVSAACVPATTPHTHAARARPWIAFSRTRAPNTARPAICDAMRVDLREWRAISRPSALTAQPTCQICCCGAQQHSHTATVAPDCSTVESAFWRRLRARPGHRVATHCALVARPRGCVVAVRLRAVGVELVAAPPRRAPTPWTW